MNRKGVPLKEPDEKKVVTVSVRLTERERDKLEEMAADEERTVSSLLQKLIRNATLVQ